MVGALVDDEHGVDRGEHGLVGGEGREDEVAASYPLKRLGVPDDIGSVVAFLLSAAA